ISLTANQTPGAVSETLSEGGGAVNVDTNSASVSNTPDLKLSILPGTTVTAMGAITIRTGYNVDAPAVPDPSRYFQGVDAGTDTITFTAKHGFHDGITVTYAAGGGAVTGGLAEGLTASVIVVDEYTIMLGSEFEGAHVEADTNTIRFGRTYSYTDDTGLHVVFAPIGHGFTEDQIVIYRANGASIPGLVDGRSYRVHVVDDTGIQLYELTAPMTPIVLIMISVDDYNDPDDADDDAVDTINAGNSYTNGQLVIYSAPAAAASFQSGYVDLQVDGSGNLVKSGSSFVSENNDTIYIAGHGFTTGTEVVYSSGLAAPISGLVSGVHYWVIRIDANRIRLADSYCHAVGAAGGASCIVGYNDWDELVGYNDWDENVGTEDDPIIVHHHDPIYVHHHDPIYETVTALPIAASGGYDVVHKLFRMSQRPIDGLVDGAQYYIVNGDSDSFQLASTAGGTPIDISVAGRGVFDLIGSFVSGPVDLGVGTGTGRLVFDLGAFGSGAEKVTPIGASEPVPAGSRLSSATVRSNGGGLVNVGKARTDAHVDADIDLLIGAGARVTSGADDAITDTGSFTITTDAYGDSQSIATNGGGGLVSVGNARANAGVSVDTTVTVGVGAVLVSGWDLLVQPVTRGRVSAKSSSSQGGLGAGVTAEANGVVDLATVIDIDGSLIAEHLLTIAGFTQPNGSIDARANGSGLGADTSGNDCSPQENCRLFARGDTVIDVAGATTVLQADELTIRARMGTDASDIGGHLSSYAYSKAKALGADSDTTSRIDIEGGATITVHTGVRLTGWERILIAAENSGLYATSTSDANCSCGGGDTDSTSRINTTLTSSVNVEQHVLVQTWYLEVQSTYLDGGRDVHAPADEAFLDDGSQSASAPQTGNHPIVWNADVVLHAADPQFVVDANGKILKSYNVTARHTPGGAAYAVGDHVDPGTVYLDQIDNLGGAIANFRINANPVAGNGTLSGLLGTFQLQPTFDFVHVYNWSDRTIQLSGIDVVNLVNLAATVSEWAYTEVASFNYLIRPASFVRTHVEIVNFAHAGGANDIVLTGEVYNPIGDVLIDNQNRDIVSQNTLAFDVVANEVTLSARAGSIGALAGSGTPRVGIAVRLIEYATGSASAPLTHPIAVALDAAEDLVVDLQAIRRRVDTSALTWTIGRVVAGGTVDIEVLDSAVSSLPAPFPGHSIYDAVYDAQGFISVLVTSYGGEVSPSGLYSTHFYPDHGYSFGDVVLIAFDTDPAHETPTDSAYVFTDVAAGEVISIHHSSPDTTITLTVTSDIDADIPNPHLPASYVANPALPGDWYAQSDGSGRIDLFTNGWINEHETVGDMLVGTIESTDADVTLLADDMLASIVDATGDAAADVIGTHLTMTANGTIGETVDHLEVRSSNAARGWVWASAPHGIYLDQTTGDLVLRTVTATTGGVATGDVSLTALDGSIVNDVNDATVRVVGVSIDLFATGGHIGSADGSADIHIDTAIDGRLLAEGENGLFITEFSGPLTLLLGASSAGRVRITVPYAAGRTDADLTLLASGDTVDGSRTILVGGADAFGTVELRAGNDVLAPLGTLIRGTQAIIRTAFGQNPAAPVDTTAYFGGELTATDAAPYIEVFGGN
ncbi:MAG TPA: hypothetical protein VFN04_01830, partial [Protaetiibacter sp.]|nr:hypothetical protein [Protaetiibacter sp.]